jgi:hypothetical protein
VVSIVGEAVDPRSDLEGKWQVAVPPEDVLVDMAKSPGPSNCTLVGQVAQSLCKALVVSLAGDGGDLRVRVFVASGVEPRASPRLRFARVSIYRDGRFPHELGSEVARLTPQTASVG